jgi:hypothetical protein
MFNLDNVCDLNLIYDKSSGYEYSLPRNVLESFLSGKAFDHPFLYSEEEKRNLLEDIKELFQHILSSTPSKEKTAIITAGAPGAGKTIKLQQDLQENISKGKNFAYICPDDVCLQNQTRTYKADIKNSNHSKEARLAAYNKWRPGSNAATHLILANLIRGEYAFYFGTTSSHPSVGKFFDFLKKQRYQIRVIHVTAPDDVRWKSIEERDHIFIQTNEQDVKEKGLLLPQRIQDTFLAYADKIDFYYRDGVKQDAQLAAKWIRKSDCSEPLGTLQIISPPQYEKIKMIHNTAVKIVQEKNPDVKINIEWESTVEKSSKFVIG